MSNGCGGSGNGRSTNWKTRSIVLLLSATLLQSCASNGWRNAVNESSLYDPPTITLLPGKVYEYREGVLVGKGQQFHSQYSYQRAVIIGK